MDMFKTPLRSQNGFTIIELLLVLMVMGILAGLAVPFYQDFVGKAYRAQALGISSEIRAGIVLRFLKSSNDPALPMTFAATLDSAVVGLCETTNPCFDQILNQPIVDKSWRKNTSVVYEHNRSGMVCTYSQNGAVNLAGQWNCVN